MKRGLGRIALVAGGLVVLSFACGEDDAVAIRRAELAEGCSLNSDCSSPLVCAFQSCHVECQSSRDCEPGALCVQADRPVYVCQLPKERTCTRNSDCAGTAICGPDARCRDGCVTDRDCLPTYQCTVGVCADMAEIVDGKLPAPPAPTEPEGTPCVHATDCPGALVCVRGFCGARVPHDERLLRDLDVYRVALRATGG